MTPELVPRVILASQSPRRMELLRRIGLSFESQAADVDERYRMGEEPGAHAERLAREKAMSVASRERDALIIGSDTVVVIDNEVLGKPQDPEDAVRMLLRLQGREHTVATGIAVAYRDRVHSAVERVAVRFRQFDERTARDYAATGEPMDKAGAYGIQGYGAALVSGITGDYFAVMGLPIVRLVLLLQDAGFRYNFRELVPVGG